MTSHRREKTDALHLDLIQSFETLLVLAIAASWVELEEWILRHGYCHFLLEKERDNNDPNFLRCLQLSRKEVFLSQVFIHYAETMAIEEELATVIAEQANSSA